MNIYIEPWLSMQFHLLLANIAVFVSALDKISAFSADKPYPTNACANLQFEDSQQSILVNYPNVAGNTIKCYNPKLNKSILIVPNCTQNYAENIEIVYYGPPGRMICKNPRFNPHATKKKDTTNDILSHILQTTPSPDSTETIPRRKRSNFRNKKSQSKKNH